MGWESIISQMDPGPRWKKHRRIIQEKFGPRHLNDYARMQKRVTYNFLAGLGKTPERLGDHIKRYAGLPPTSLVGLYHDCAIHTGSVRSFINVPVTSRD